MSSKTSAVFFRVQGLREKRYSPLTWGVHTGCEWFWDYCIKHILGGHSVLRSAVL